MSKFRAADGANKARAAGPFRRGVTVNSARHSRTINN